MTDEELSSWTRTSTRCSTSDLRATRFGTDTDPTYALDSHAQQLTKAFRNVKELLERRQVRRHPADGHARDVLLDADLIAATNAILAETQSPTAIQDEADEVAHVHGHRRATSSTTRCGR
jgi:hypothetical protein